VGSCVVGDHVSGDELSEGKLSSKTYELLEINCQG
jgi:hypothetical protein